MSDLQGSMIWYELMTSDAAGAKAFYDAVLGWSIDSEGQGPVDYRMIAAGDGELVGGVLPLTDAMCENGARPGWLGYIGVDDVDATVSAIEQAGGKALMPPWDIPGTGRVAMVADPGGAPFYVMTPTPPPGREQEKSTAFDPARAGHCTWNELHAPDDQAAIEFYSARFGWKKDGAMPMGEMGDYSFLNHGGVQIGAVMPTQGDTPPHWHYFFRVDRIDDAAARLTSAGGSIVNGPHEVPGGDFVIYAKDPHGAAFGIVGKR